MEIYSDTLTGLKITEKIVEGRLYLHCDASYGFRQNFAHACSVI